MKTELTDLKGAFATISLICEPVKQVTTFSICLTKNKIPGGFFGRTRQPPTRSLQTFRIFSQHLKWVIRTVNRQKVRSIALIE